MQKSYTLSSWSHAVLQSLIEQNGDNLISLLNPQIKVTEKDKLGSTDQVPHDL